MVDVRDVLEGRVDPDGRVVVVDELGFHQATSTAELLADRGCQVEIVTNGMVVAQDLGVTLDMETWNVKAHAKGIGQSVDLVPDGRAASPVATGTAQPVGRAQPAAPPDRHRPGARLRLGGVLPCTNSPRTTCGASSGTAPSPSTGSATAWLPGGPTPR